LAGCPFHIPTLLATLQAAYAQDSTSASRLFDALRLQQRRLAQWEQNVAIHLEKIVSIQRGLTESPLT
jgi:hypothetical protein